MSAVAPQTTANPSFETLSEGLDQLGTSLDRLLAQKAALLAALKMVREEDDAYDLPFNEQQRDQIHDAIAKAEGRS